MRSHIAFNRKIQLDENFDEVSLEDDAIEQPKPVTTSSDTCLPFCFFNTQSTPAKEELAPTQQYEHDAQTPPQMKRCVII